ncbi:SAM-dependent methyltransferase [Bacillus benzoevorans]|uniref:Ubiquinone/menaquinone biosynthesis C-methylase UbiE n=1 Tax=Bacillus benzoevorans TaxID=1456 RepID=A0A7X0HT13_9BACI|nr:SAM-dependent methyltransferase [Bacillus benzoevorans]MBB6446317.1 ubiquinone/menaquinone biosynthesis C-methylase UbiE [Bacillus benzoevorans]
MSAAEQRTKLELERIIFIGRTYEEYLSMFSLSFDELKGKKILDCPAGACSFTAWGNQAGLDITACDIAYDHRIEDLKDKGKQDIGHTMEVMESAKGNYIWDFFRDIDGLRKHRLSALEDCTAHMRKHRSRYVPVVLPVLPFENEKFDLLLSAHFLFMYADRLDYQYHIETLRELLRVTKDEIRIFPLIDLEGKRYEHLDKIIDYLTGLGCIVKEETVPYEFMINGNSMLKIRKNNYEG